MHFLLTVLDKRVHTHSYAYTTKRRSLLARGSCRARTERNRIRYTENLKIREKKQKNHEIYRIFFFPVVLAVSVHLSSSTPDNRRHFMLDSRTTRTSTLLLTISAPLPLPCPTLCDTYDDDDDDDEDDELSSTHATKALPILPPTISTATTTNLLSSAKSAVLRK
jgi:hypothetical protein